MPPKKEAKAVEFLVPEIIMARMTLWLIGVTGVIPHRFGPRAIEKIEDKQQGVAQTGPRAKRVPQEELVDAFYLDRDDRCVLPSGAFKQSAIGAGKYVGIPMTRLGGVFTVLGNGDVPIYGADPVGRADMVRLPDGTPMPAYRPEFLDWAVKLDIQYIKSIISEQQLATLFQWAGTTIGVCDWRPEKGGDHGCYRLAMKGEEKKYINRIPDYLAARVTSAQERAVVQASTGVASHATDGVATRTPKGKRNKPNGKSNGAHVSE